MTAEQAYEDIATAILEEVFERLTEDANWFNPPQP